MIVAKQQTTADRRIVRTLILSVFFIFSFVPSDGSERS